MKTLAFVGCLVLLGTGCNSHTLSTEKQSRLQGMTFAELHEKGMINYVNKEFLLSSKFEWSYANNTYPENPKPIEEIQKMAGHLGLPYDDIPNLPEVKTRATISVFSNKITKTKDRSGKEIYAYENMPLSNNAKSYTLKVKLMFSREYPDEILQNPKFIEEANSPTYWAQKYKMEILEIH